MHDGHARISGAHKIRAALVALVALAVILAGVARSEPARADPGTGGYTTSSARLAARSTAVAVDSQNGKTYVVGTGTLEVIDTATKKVTATVTLNPRHDASLPILLGVAVDPTRQRAYISDNVDDIELVVSLTTNKLIGTVALPSYDDPGAVAIDTATGDVYVADFNADQVHAISEATNRVIATTSLPLNLALNDLAIDHDKGLIYVTTYTDGYVYAIGMSSHKVVAKRRISTVDYDLYGVTVDPATDTVYAALAKSDEVVVLTSTLSKVVTTISGFDNPQSLALDQGGNRLFVGNNAFNATVTAVDTSTDTAVGTVPLGEYIADVTVDPVTGDASVIGGGIGSTAEDDTLFTVTGPPVIRSAAPSATIATGSPFSLHVVTNVASPSYSLASGALPAGLTIDGSTGVISGTPTTAGASSYTVQAVGTNGTAVSPTYTQQVATVGRVAGSDRYATSAAVSQNEFPGTAPVVYIASGANYPDALSAGPVAAKEGGPVLLTAPGSLPDVVATEVRRLDPSRVVVVGGTAAVSPQVLADLATNAPDATIVRVAGSDRFATSQDLVSSAFSTADTVYLATGENYPDALSAGAVAAKVGAPVLLVNGLAKTLYSTTAAELTSLATTHVDVIGGTAAVSPGIVSSLKGSGYTVTTLAGTSRYDTAEVVDSSAYQSASTVDLAVGTEFPDAMSAAGWAGTSSSPLFLSEGTCVPASVLTAIRSDGATTVTLVGGTAALAESVQRLTPCGS